MGAIVSVTNKSTVYMRSHHDDHRYGCNESSQERTAEDDIEEPEAEEA